ncbi:TRAP transporter large permease [Arthrobacter sp. B6]|uniref:TRAP transporter large permease n=1 Tax=Arthrobacter sp. B6 TaxID=1570137 RepID=UPI0009EF5A28|nr:TRAP transporter large permease subunit [Arthrobacter sp. B6]
MFDLQKSIPPNPLVAEAVTPSIGKAPAKRFPAWFVRGISASLVIAPVIIVFVADTREAVGVAAIALMIVLMFLKVPVFFALAVPGFLGLYALNGSLAVENAMRTIPYGSVAQWSLTVIPLFVLMGALFAESGLTTRIFLAARHWLGWLPGGLAVGTNVAGAGLAAVSGSTVATTYAIGKVAIPEMLKAGYSKHLAVGAVAVSSLPGQLIPPSILLMIYAGIAEVPIGPQLMAGILPGVLITAVMIITIIVVTSLFPKMVGKDTVGAKKAAGEGWGARFRSLGGTWPLPVILFVTVFGIYTGIFTATESGAFAALASIIVCFVFRRGDKPLQRIYNAAAGTVSTCGAMFLLLIGSYVLSQLVAVTGLGRAFSTWVIELGLGPIEFLLVLTVIYLIMGTAMDSLAILLLTVPLLLPTLIALDIPLIWFGIFVVILGEIAVLSPPVGLLSFIIHSMVKNERTLSGEKITLGDVFNSILMFFPSILLTILLLILYPDIVLWIPNAMEGQ